MKRQMLPLLVDAARAMDSIFWIESYGARDALMSRISDPPAVLAEDLDRLGAKAIPVDIVYDQ